METATQVVTAVNGVVWGPAMLALIAGTGAFLMWRLRLIPLRKIPHGFRLMLRKPTLGSSGDIAPFQALMTSLSATVGTGNIAGVATAISLGGPGALFWMWLIALVGMATKYAEAVCAVRYREVDAHGNSIGGPMFAMRNGLGGRWSILGGAFAVFGALAGFGIGNTVQSNSVADALATTFGVPPWLTGVVLAVLVLAVLVGGIKRIAKVTSSLVPMMALLYLFAGLVIIVLRVGDIPAALITIVSSAFTGSAATGGFAGATMVLAMRYGVARGVFSNEAGLGSAAIAHAAARTDSPVQQGTIAMLGTFIDTLVICSITGMVIVLTGAYSGGEKGASLSAAAFESVLSGAGSYVVSIGLALFAFTTLIGWSYYSEKCAEYLFGERVILPFRLIWVAAVPIGPIAPLSFVWLVADTLNALMAVPNLISLIMLSPIVVKLTRQHFGAGDADLSGSHAGEVSQPAIQSL